MTDPTEASDVPGIDPSYVEARRVFLDALVALAPQGAAFIVAGAQAIYLRTGEADIAVAPYTTDGDLTLDPSRLVDEPLLESAMRAAGFELADMGGHVEPGIWMAQGNIAGTAVLIPIDLIVPETVASGGGRRGARLGVHGKLAARRARGLEGVLVDHSTMTITALDPTDTRSVAAEVAGPAALLVAKAHKPLATSSNCSAGAAPAAPRWRCARCALACHRRVWRRCALATRGGFSARHAVSARLAERLSSLEATRSMRLPCQASLGGTVWPRANPDSTGGKSCDGRRGAG